VRKQKAKNKEFFTYFIDGINGKIRITVLKNALLKSAAKVLCYEKRLFQSLRDISACGIFWVRQYYEQ
jgi:hypothetical protein